MYYICRRGRENQRTMTKDTFGIGEDGSGRAYVYQQVDESDKNHQNCANDDTVGEGRMYSIPGNPLCPVSSFRNYLSKLNPDCQVKSCGNVHWT